MLKKIVFAAAAAAVVLGAGTAALAASGSTGSPSASPSGSASAPAKPGTAAHAPGTHRRPLRALGRALHAQWVTPDRTDKNAYVTHDAIRGTVTAVSATSITVKAADGVLQTYAVTADTKVHLRKHLPGQGKAPGATGQAKGQQGAPAKGGATAGTIGDVHAGNTVAVTGTGTNSLTAQHILAATG